MTSGPYSRLRLPEEDEADELDEGARGAAARHHEDLLGDASEASSWNSYASTIAWWMRHLADEPVEQRHPGDAAAAISMNTNVSGILLPQAAELVHVELARAEEDRAHPEEQRPLEQRVVDHVVEPAGHPHGTCAPR